MHTSVVNITDRTLRRGRRGAASPTGPLDRRGPQAHHRRVTEQNGNLSNAHWEAEGRMQDQSRTRRTPALADGIIAKLLATPWLMRLPIPLYRAGGGWLFGSRLVMIEHLGRASHQPRYVVVEVVERRPDAIFVASGLGSRSQWYRNLRANGVAYLTIGHARRVRAHVRLLDNPQSREVLQRYAQAHPSTWRHLKGAMDAAAGGDARIPIVEFTKPRTQGLTGATTAPAGAGRPVVLHLRPRRRGRTRGRRPEHPPGRTAPKCFWIRASQPIPR